MRSVLPVVRMFHHAEFDATDLAARKDGDTVTVCLPARNEAETVGAIVTTVREQLVERHGLVDEIVVVDDHSVDGTATIAEDAGARVVHAAGVLPGYGHGHGKGAALWKGLAESDGDLVVWCDADIVGFEPQFVTGLLGPLLTVPELGFVKGFYDRPAQDGDRGGRVTELVARPALALLFPQLASIVQPLAGEYAGRREVLEQLPFVEGYGVDVALLIDVAERFGLDTIGQVDLGTRVHRNRPIDELSPQATAVLHAVLSRAGRSIPDHVTLHRPGLDPVDVTLAERPPLVTIADDDMRRRA